ncbi:MAG: phosphatase PAP2 family protein [candidate division KSB1 bacterium]|nr:phosphatase PAP2 family protein [candidate division KSB1 bacterium]
MNKKPVMFLVIFTQILCLGSLSLAQSPYRISWGKDAPLFGSGVVFAVVASSMNQNIVPLTVAEINSLSRNDVNWFDRKATYHYSTDSGDLSNIALGVCLTLPATLFISKRLHNDFITVGLMYAEVLLFSNFVPSVVKSAAPRIRPFVYNPEAPLEAKTTTGAKKSFFSSHATNAFAAAVFFSTVYGDYFPDSKWRPYLWAGSLAAASFVGYLRYDAGKHFPTDVLVGAGVGSAIGFLWPYLHRVHTQDGLSLVPIYTPRQIRLGLYYSFSNPH